ncbi:MAG: hypothetical protein M0Z89_13285 [Nitrospiraceae bacterium]|nr:hypothetical protein [Nitrospiraceae bacterium]
MSVAILAGFIIGKLRLEKWVEEYVYKIQSIGGAITAALRYDIMSFR